jgi:DNA polymerase-1
MILLDHRLIQGNFQARMLLQIHDELVFEAPQDEIPRLAELVRHTMTTALDLNVPLTVDVAAGANWLDVTSIPATQSQ